MTISPNPANPDLDTLCNIPGPEGVLWRLVKLWDPNGIQTWLAGEAVRGTSIDDLLRALGNMLSAAAFGVAVNTDNPREALMGRAGILDHFNASLQAKVNTYKSATPSGIIMPKPGEMQ
jgi:hypothetical protein